MTRSLSRDKSCPVSRKLANLSHHVGRRVGDGSYDENLRRAAVRWRACPAVANVCREGQTPEARQGPVSGYDMMSVTSRASA
jgi:hypothetical protein